MWGAVVSPWKSGGKKKPTEQSVLRQFSKLDVFYQTSGFGADFLSSQGHSSETSSLFMKRLI